MSFELNNLDNSLKKILSITKILDFFGGKIFFFETKNLKIFIIF